MTIEFGTPVVIEDLTDQVEDFVEPPTVSQKRIVTKEVDLFDVLRQSDPKCRAEYQAFFGGGS